MANRRRCRRSRLVALCARLVPLLFSVLLTACSRSTVPPQEIPRNSPRRDANVLLITIDTLRADYLFCYGKKTVSTPNVDALAARGVRFTQAVAQIPLTTPSHASILTGTYPQMHKVRDIEGFVLDNKLPTLASIASQGGLETGAIVGAAVLNRRFGLSNGFKSYFDDMKEEKTVGRLPGMVAEIRAEVVTRHAIDWLDREKRQGIGVTPGKDFLLWVHYYDPHFPYDPPGPYRSKYAKDPYGGEVAYTDEQIGHLLGWMRDQRLLDRTLVVLLSDHGESLGEHGEYTHGVFLYESTIHIPLIVAGSGVPEGQVITQQVRSIDVMPTILDYLGLSAGSQVQGTSLMPAIVEGKRVRTNYSYMETLYPKTHLGWSELRGMRTDEWKLVVGPKSELYRLADDPDERHDVAIQFPADSDRLQKQVWTVAGPPQSLGTLQMRPVDEQTRQQLQSLGYASAGTPRDIRIDMSGPDPRDRIQVLSILEKAGNLMNRERFHQAVPLLEDILRQDPTNPLIYQHLGVCYEQLGQFLKAARLYQEAIRNKADTDETYAELGEIFLRLGAKARAMEFMEQAASLNPANLKNLDNLATVYLEKGRTDDVDRVLRIILAQDDHHPMANNLLGILEVQRGHEQLARSYFEKAIQSNPDLAQAYMNLGILAQNAGQNQQAITYFKMFLEKADPKEHRDIIPKVRKALSELQSKPS
ncbi:MAG TPA: sulfatase-like hydrolase/transferase [Terriglobia bacterium]|nr:sulfatase-like hydrolase/transferase [Terriglobia bacterium]